MSRDRTLARILECGIVAVVRSETSEPLVKVAKALAEGGVTAIEVTFTVPGAIDVIRQVSQELGDSIVLGAGTVLDPETARAAILAGAEYIVAPTLNHEVIRLCRRYDKAVMPGALTPTEVLSAWEAGADVVKIFPADVGRPRVSQGASRASSPDSAHAHRRRRPDHGGELPQSRRVLPGRRQRPGRRPKPSRPATSLAFATSQRSSARSSANFVAETAEIHTLSTASSHTSMNSPSFLAFAFRQRGARSMRRPGPIRRRNSFRSEHPIDSFQGERELRSINPA